MQGLAIICLTILALRIISSIDKNKEVKILRLRKDILKMGGKVDEQRINQNNAR